MSGIKQLSFKLVPGENATELLDTQAYSWYLVSTTMANQWLIPRIGLSMVEHAQA